MCLLVRGQEGLHKLNLKDFDFFKRNVGNEFFMIKFKYKASKATIDLGTAFQQKPGLNLSMFLAENKPSC